MDKLGTGGYVSFWILIVVSMIIGVGIMGYIDIPSILVVVGGTSANITASYDLSILKNVSKAIKVAFSELKTEDNTKMVQKIVFYATEVKKKGKMAIESTVEKEEDTFFKEALSLIVDGTKPEIIEQLLEVKIEHLQIRHAKMHHLFDQVSSVAGAMGMAGTLIGLIAMLANLADPSTVGPAMATALLTTLYGTLIGAGFAGPIGNRLGVKSRLEVDSMNIVKQGILLIAQDEPIGEIKIKLNSVLSYG